MTVKKPSSGTSDVGLPLAVRDGLVAVVFDANSMGAGRPNLDELIYLAEHLSELAIEAWVPEPVAWEWAEHLGADWTAMRVKVATEVRALRTAGLDVPDSPFHEAGEVREAFLTLLDAVPNLTVIPLSSGNALLGLRDQVLQLPPARKKEGVKTGASDSAWLRDVLARVGGAPTRILIVSDDRDVPAAFEAWGTPPPLLRKRRELLPSLFTFKVDDGAATEVILRYLGTHLPTPQGHNLLDVGAAPDLRDVVKRILDLPGGTRIDGVTLAEVVDVVGLTSVNVETTRPAEQAADKAESTGVVDDHDAGARAAGPFGHRDDMVPHTVRVTLMLLADAEAVTTTAGPDGADATSVVRVRDLLLRASMVFELEAGMMAKPPRPDGEVAVWGYADRFDSSEEALDELHEALTCVPGLDLEDEWHEPYDLVHREVNGHDIMLAPHVDDGTGSIDITVDDTTVNLACAYDPGSRVWLGRQDSFDIHPPYEVRLRGIGARDRSPNPIWALASWLTGRLHD